MQRTVPVFVLALSLGLTTAPGFVDSFWAQLSALWAGTDEGCIMDPSGGRCLPAPSDNLDEGCGADPNGRCLPAPSDNLDEGCGADPDGHCKPGS